MPTHEGLGADDRDGLEDRRKPSIQLDQEQAIPIQPIAHAAGTALVATPTGQHGGPRGPLAHTALRGYPRRRTMGSPVISSRQVRTPAAKEQLEFGRMARNVLTF